MKKIKVDDIFMQELQYAFENSFFDSQHFLDLKSGEITMRSDYDDYDEGEDEENEDFIEDEINKDDEDRYIPIPKPDQREAYGDMEEFAETITDENLKEKLGSFVNKVQLLVIK